LRSGFPTLAALLLIATPAVAGPKVGIVVGPDAPKLEQFAADEVAARFKQLFHAEATVIGKIPTGVDHLILVGSPATNPSVKEAMGDRWPKLTGQGHIVQTAKLGDRPALVVGGGSPTATLWAAYELGHHFGIRSFLHGDVMPEKAPELKLDGIDISREPGLKVRAWRVLDDSPLGFAAWGLDDHKRLLAQLAKLKFTHVEIGVESAPPVVSRGLQAIPVAGDVPGRKAFKGAKEFINPVLAGKATDADRTAALVALAAEIRKSAPAFGLQVAAEPAIARPLLLRGMLPRVGTRPAPSGFVVIAEAPGDVSPAAYFLSRQAFEPKLTPQAADANLFTPILGKLATERVLLGFDMIDRANALIAKQDPKGADVSPRAVAAQLELTDAPPDWWKEAGKLYTEAMNEMYRGIRATFNDPARQVLLYYAKRCEFAVHYFAALEAARLAGVAKAKGEKDAAVTHIEKAMESLYNGLTAQGDVARDPGDRGVIAVVAEESYRPLKAALKEAE
jgi:hypothetical protein